jgi:hypothetical protein
MRLNVRRAKPGVLMRRRISDILRFAQDEVKIQGPRPITFGFREPLYWLA